MEILLWENFEGRTSNERRIDKWKRTHEGRRTEILKSNHTLWKWME